MRVLEEYRELNWTCSCDLLTILAFDRVAQGGRGLGRRGVVVELRIGSHDVTRLIGPNAAAHTTADYGYIYM